MSGAAQAEAVLGWEEGPSTNPWSVRALCCSLGGDYLTSGDGELFAMEALVSRAMPLPLVFTDYKTIVDGLRRGKGWCTAGDKMQAERWTSIWRSCEI